MAKRAASRVRHKAAATTADPKAQAARLYGEGRYGEALRAAAAALRGCPQDAELWNLSGGAALALGLIQDAEQFWKVAIARNPDHADAHYNLGLLHYRRHELDAAARSFSRAITLRPNHAAALNNLGAVLQARGRLAEAATVLQRSVSIDPGNAAALNNLGLALSELGRFDAAQVALDRAIELKPDFVEALTSRGRLSIETGDPAAARGFLEAALAVNPEWAEAYYCMSQLPAVGDGPWVGRLEAAYEKRAALTPAAAATLCFAMGKVREDRGAYDPAFDAYAEGNRLRYAQQPFDEEEDERWLAASIASFTAELYSTGAPADCAAPASTEPRVPIFIVGMPRSGTTLIEQVLASHPDIAGAGELSTLFELAAKLPRGAPAPEQRPAWLAALRALGEEYRARVWTAGVNRRFVTDKMPGNYWYLGLMPLMFPHAKIIHVLRDPMDTCFSCYATPFVRGHEYAFDLEMLGRSYLRYHRLMEHWNAVLPAGHILSVRYEAVVADLEHEARRMLTHIGLPWNEACLDFHANPRAVRTASVMQVRRRVYSGSIARWRRFERHLEPLRALLAPILDDGAGVCAATAASAAVTAAAP